MKTLVIVAHPHIEQSVVNKRWVEELEKYPHQFTVRSIYDLYRNQKIDVSKEQALIDKHEAIVFQYPMYWFNCPPLLKQWLNDVFTHGWAYGSKGNKMKNKKIALAVSAGIKEEDFSEHGKMKVTIEQLLLPMKTTAFYTKSDFRGSFVLYDTHNAVSSGALQQSVTDYIKFLHTI